MKHSPMYDARVTELTDEKARENGAASGHAAMTIDELARHTGMTVRNIRAHQSRGLVPPPEVRGRTGYYGDEHRARIELIKELQADGFNLESIRRLLEDAGGSSSEVLNFSRTLRAPFEDEEPEILAAGEMEKRWGGADPELLKRAEKLGMMRPLGDGRYEILSPRLQRAGIELAALGIPAEKSLEIGEKVRRQARGVAADGGDANRSRRRDPVTPRSTGSRAGAQWGRQDSNLRRQSHGVYSATPLTAWVLPRGRRF